MYGKNKIMEIGICLELSNSETTISKAVEYS